MMNTSNWKRLLLLAVIAAWPCAASATNLWAPLTTSPYLSTSNPNYTAPYVWGSDPFTLTGSSGFVAGSTLIGQPVQIAPFSTSQGGDQPTPIWTGSSGAFNNSRSIRRVRPAATTTAWSASIPAAPPASWPGCRRPIRSIRP